MHIGMVHLSAGKFPPDIRVEKEIAALVQAGMKVSVLCRRVSDDEPEEEELVSGAIVYRCRVQKRSLLRRVLAQIDLWTMIYTSYKPMLAEFLNVACPDVLHVHDLPMVPTTLAVAQTRDMPVVADMHENYPAALSAWRSDQPWYRRFRQALRTNSHAYRYHEMRCAPRCERIVVVVPEAAERFLRRGIPPEKIVVVSNTEDETTMPWPLPSIDPVIAAEFPGKWVASYVGGIGPHRGIDTVIRGVRKIAAAVPNFLLLIVGAKDGQQEKLRRIVAECKAEQYVDIRGWEPFERCLQYDLIGNVGLVPHNNTEHTQTTVPHKLFQYMLCGRPVVVSDCAPLKRIVEETRAGEIFRANDPDDFARTIIRLAGDVELCSHYGRNGQEAARGRYAWKHDAARLVEMYTQIAKKRG